MAGNGSITPVTILLLVMGVIVGGSVGYIYMSSTLQPKIVQYEQQVDELTSINLGVSTTVAELERQNADLDAQISGYESHVSSLQDNITQLESELSELVLNLTTAADEIAEKDKIIYERSTEIAILRNRLGNRLDWYVYDECNLYFEYPNGMTLSEIITTENVGLIFGIQISDENAIFVTIGWVYNTTHPDLEEFINSVFSEMEDEDITRKLTFNSSINDHTLIYEYFTTVHEGIPVDGVLGSWYCEKTQRCFYITYTSARNVFQGFHQIMSTFVCHGEGLKY